MSKDLTGAIKNFDEWVKRAIDAERQLAEAREALSAIAEDRWNMDNPPLGGITVQEFAAQFLAADAPVREAEQEVWQIAMKIPAEYKQWHKGADEERARTGEVGSQHRDRFESWVDTLEEAFEALAAAKEPKKEQDDGPS